MSPESITALAAAITALGGVVATLIKNSRDINRLKRYACFRLPCPERLSEEALQSKSRGFK